MMGLINKLKPVRVDLFVYQFPKEKTLNNRPEDKLPYPIIENPKDVFCFMDKHYRAHKSKVFRGSRLLNSFGYPSNLYNIGDCLTPEGYRGKGLFPAMLGFITQKFTDLPIFILVSPSNKASIRGIEKAGFNRISRIQCLKIGPIYLQKSKEVIVKL